MDEMNLDMMNEELEPVPDPLVNATARELADAIAAFIDSKRGRDVKVIAMEGKTDICEYMVLATGTSATHVRTLAGEVEYQMSRRLVEPLHVEGRDNQSWIVLDYSHVLVHVFTKDTREFYNLDKLYGED